jgi:hypothetical protein
MNEEELKKEYRDLKNRTVPDLWNRIDAGLAPHAQKETESPVEKTGAETPEPKVIRFKKSWAYTLSGAAAVIILAVGLSSGRMHGTSTAPIAPAGSATTAAAAAMAQPVPSVSSTAAAAAQPTAAAKAAADNRASARSEDRVFAENAPDNAMQEPAEAPQAEVFAAASPSLPSGVTRSGSVSTDRNASLYAAIGKTFGLSGDALSSVSCRYTCVDLNHDNTEEVLAFVTGSSVPDGKCILWLSKDPDMKVIQEWDSAEAPVIISDEISGGANELVMNITGENGEVKHLLLTCSGGHYTALSDAEEVNDYGSIRGTAVLCSD